MATTVALRKILDRKQWEIVSSPPLAFSATSTACYSTLQDQYQFWMDGVSSVWLYDPREDAWMRLANSGMTTFSVNNGYLCYHPSGPTGTASAGGAATITTALTLPGSLAGYTIRITGGTGAGQERTIASNTYGANSVITVSSAWGTTPDNTSTFLLVTGRLWAFQGNTTVGLRYYDVALNTWSSALSVTGITAASAEWRIVATPAYGSTIASGTATSGAATTITNSGKAWATNQWANYQVRITTGTGAGQVRAVTSNTATELTVATWTVNPDNTSQYVLESNDDYLYASVGNAVTLYRYSISGNSWSTLSPGTARSASAGAGHSLQWISVVSDTSWADEANIKNGRYLYSFLGGSSGNVQYYDIAANTWVNVDAAYGRSGDAGFAVSQGVGFAVEREFIYIIKALGSGSCPCWRYNTVTQNLDPWTMWTMPYTSSGSGNRATIASYADGGTTIRWVHFIAGAPSAGPTPFLRMMII